MGYLDNTFSHLQSPSTPPFNIVVLKICVDLVLKTIFILLSHYFFCDSYPIILEKEIYGENVLFNLYACANR